MRKETHISTHKEEYKKGGEENRKHLENDPHTKKKRSKGPDVQFCWGYICPKATRKAHCFLSIISPNWGD